MKYLDSNIVKNVFLKKTILANSDDKWLTFRNTEKNFDLEGNNLKILTNKNGKVDLAKTSDEQCKV